MKNISVIMFSTVLCVALNVAAAEAGRLSCDAVRHMKSTDGGKNVTITFINKTTELRTAMWVDFKGNPVQYFTLEAGQSYKQQTWTTHPWFFTDGPGNCIEAMIPSASKSTYKIKVPSPGFGDE